MTQTERDALLDAALIHVPFDGMNDRALMAGARDLGIPDQMARVHFPEGGAALAAAYHRRADAELARMLADTPLDGRFRDKVAQAVWLRLGLVDRELVRAGATVLALPHHAGLAAKLVWETADVIWRALGDTSDDVNWYSKRATLSAVISASVLFWLGDDSDGQADTRAFIDRRIDGVMRFEGVKANLRKLPGMDMLTRAAFGWIRAPQPRDLPGRGE
ncbi:COQ9 family protein [Paracoccus sp. (in: a-proteobacteria)]|uniref:COQ9 family protein n=1 Tax=Paracoccus sp. TaxID=267 RepID=UPI0026DFF607|nr:COQ9 family protein [Paracoccus sp. (in: a-proteobacteria)]MDO5648335.1 COQ9 family protein [Paracoccus sp. (in: a-proteobacteria)]